MQRIITAVKNAGKLPYLAKVPYSNGQYLARNSLYQTYNQVIDQLVATEQHPGDSPGFLYLVPEPSKSDNLRWLASERHRLSVHGESVV